MQSGLLQLIMNDKNEVNRWAGQLQMSALTLNTTQYDCLILTFVSKVISAIKNLCCYLHTIDKQCTKYESLTSSKNVVTK